MVLAADLAPSRPPCSAAEREAARVVARTLRRLGYRPQTLPLRAPTSPTWAPLLRALLRVWAASFLAAGLPQASAALSGTAILGGLPSVAGLLRFLPLLGARTQDIVAVRRGTDRRARPILVTAHLDTHPTAGAPMSRPHSVLAGLSAWAVLATSLVRSSSPPAAVAGIVAAEAVLTLGWLARRELAPKVDPPDDNTSGLLALAALARRLAAAPPHCDVWLAATGAGTSGSYGLMALLRKRPDLRQAWVIEVDALGSGEVVAAPVAPRFPHPGTPAALPRALSHAARELGDPLSVRRVRRPHSDARAALRLRTAAIALTGGLRPPDALGEPDAANAERVARLIDRLARSVA